MAKYASPQEYIDELYSGMTGNLNSSRDQRAQNDAQLIEQVNQSINTTTAAATKPYQTQLEQLPTNYQKLYDANAVQELVGRRQVQEAMANMGLTDSGLNRTQQTALALQKGNADAAVRLEQQKKTQELQDQIAQLIASGEAQKQQQAANVQYNTANWYNDALNDSYNNSVQLGYNQYNTDVDRDIAAEQRAQQMAAQEEAARLERATIEAAAVKNLEAAQLEADTKAKQQEYDNKIELAKLLIDGGLGAEEAINAVFGLSLGSTGAVEGGTSNSVSANTGAIEGGTSNSVSANTGISSGDKQVTSTIQQIMEGAKAGMIGTGLSTGIGSDEAVFVSRLKNDMSSGLSDRDALNAIVDHVYALYGADPTRSRAWTQIPESGQRLMNELISAAGLENAAMQFNLKKGLDLNRDAYF